MNLHLSYMNPISYRILFWYGWRSRQFSCLEKFFSMVVPGGGCRKGIIRQGILTPTGVLPNGQWLLRIKGDVTGAYLQAPRERNVTYVQIIRRYIYKTSRPRHPCFPIRRYKWHPQWPASCPHYNLHNSTIMKLTWRKESIILPWKQEKEKNNYYYQ